MSTEDESNLFLELGQIIQINAPSNSQINQHIYLIEYLDEDIIKLVRKTFNPFKMVSGLTKRNNTQVA